LAQDQFLIDKRLSQHVFRRHCQTYFVGEFDWLLSVDFWDWARTLERSLGGDSIVVVPIEPHPAEYFLRNFGRSNAFKFDLATKDVEYVAALSVSDSTPVLGSFAIEARTVAILPSSRSWGIWGERACNIAILGLNTPVDVSTARQFWQPLESAIASWLPLEFSDPKAFTKFANELHMNYSNANAD
jgi:hypothetical protein